MSTFVLTWNPDKWSILDAEYDQYMARTAGGESIEERWSTGSRKSGITKGARAYLLRQERDRGLVASGVFDGEVRQLAHWDPARPHDLANYATVSWDTWLPVDERLPTEALEGSIPHVHWVMQGSGIHVPEPSSTALASMWDHHLDHLGRQPVWSPDEVPPGTTYAEGATKQITVNRYERDQRARAECIRHHGTDCAVCGLSFGAHYGEDLGGGFIHVHHLKDLSLLGEDYEIDPIHDLRPVCPNCHAMLHRERPALSIDDLRRHLRP